jgi:NADPH:quinone reductase-like Zn-dependent oxidoreductase
MADETRTAAETVIDEVGLVRAGVLAPPAWTTVPLDRAADAHRALEAGGVRGRILLVP